MPKSLYVSLASGRDLLERLELPVRVQVPSQYVVASPAFVADPEGSGKLTVTLTDRRQDGKPFPGPPAKVRLDVSPVRVPDLVPDGMAGSTFRGKLRPGGRAVLAVANVRFRGPNRAGVIAVDVDGYDRASPVRDRLQRYYPAAAAGHHPPHRRPAVRHPGQAVPGAAGGG